jgi:hypothetical protein
LVCPLPLRPCFFAFLCSFRPKSSQTPDHQLVLEVFASLSAQRKNLLPGRPLVVFHSSTELSDSGAAVPLSPIKESSEQLPSLQFFPLRRIPNCGQPLGSRSNQLPGYGASSAFRTLSRLFSALSLPALFHAGPVLGVLPFKVDSHPRSRTLSQAPLPSCGWSVFLASVSAYSVMSVFQVCLGFYFPDRFSPKRLSLMVFFTVTNRLSRAYISETALQQTHSTSGPCSPRASVSPAGGLDLTEDRNPHGIFPP